MLLNAMSLSNFKISIFFSLGIFSHSLKAEESSCPRAIVKFFSIFEFSSDGAAIPIRKAFSTNPAEPLALSSVFGAGNRVAVMHWNVDGTPFVYIKGKKFGMVKSSQRFSYMDGVGNVSYGTRDVWKLQVITGDDNVGKGMSFELLDLTDLDVDLLVDSLRQAIAHSKDEVFLSPFEAYSFMLRPFLATARILDEHPTMYDSPAKFLEAWIRANVRADNAPSATYRIWTINLESAMGLKENIQRQAIIRDVSYVAVGVVTVGALVYLAKSIADGSLEKWLDKLPKGNGSNDNNFYPLGPYGLGF